MKVTRVLEITASEFFNAVFDEIIAEIKKVDNKDISRDAFKKGFKYTHKSEDVYARMDFEVIDYKKNEYYKSKKESIRAVTTVTYEVKPCERGISVTFTQEQTVKGTTPKPKKETFFSKIGDTVNLGRMTDKLYGFQRAVINEKEGMIEKQTGNLFIPNTRKSK